MSKRFRITVRGLGIELRGYMDQGLGEDQPTLEELAHAMKPFGVVVASEAEHDYNPFEEWTGHLQDRLARATRMAAHWEQQAHNLQDLVDSNMDPDEIPKVRRIIMQRREIKEAWRYVRNLQSMLKREKGLREDAQNVAGEARTELHQRELHHFETEQILDRIKAARSNHPECEKHPDDDVVKCGWKIAVQDIDRALSDVSA